MSRSDRQALLLAVILALLAGYVDALGYLTLRGFFVSFMSGNSTRFSIALAGSDRRVILTAGGLIGLFVLGVVSAALVAPDGPGRQSRMLALVAALLGLAALAATVGRDRWSIALAALAMGAESDVVRKAGPVNVTVTYMTGTLVKMARGLADALRGGPRWGWLPYALLWASLVAGVVAGTAAFPVVRLQGLWLAAAGCAALAAVTRPGPRR